MGKKKSVVLMTLLTIVIVVLCAITVFPSFAVPGTVKKWTPAIWQYDLGRDLGGGYYTYYYPEGVITETEYENNLAELPEEEKAAYAEDYLKYGGLYLSTDEDKNLVRNNGEGFEADLDFKNLVAESANVIANRFADVGYSDMRIVVVDDFAIRVELPASDTLVGQAMTMFAMTDGLTLAKGEETIEELQGKDAKITDLIKGFSTSTRYGVVSLNVNLTKEGKAMIKEMKKTLSIAAETTDASSATTLDLKVGDQVIASIFQDYVNDRNEVKIPLRNDDEKAYVTLVKVLCASVLDEGALDISFRSFGESDIRSFKPVDGENILNATYIALGVIILALAVVSVWKMGKFGIVNVYSILSYTIIVGLCYAFITKAVFEITFGSILVYLLGLLIISAVNFYIYGAIKKNLEEGKNPMSAVKNGYNKTLGGIVDVYAVSLLAALGLLISVSGLFTLALQAIICIISAAFCDLLWGRAINYVFLSANKNNEYKYFRFVRKEDDGNE